MPHFAVHKPHLNGKQKAKPGVYSVERSTLRDGREGLQGGTACAAHKALQWFGVVFSGGKEKCY